MTGIAEPPVAAAAALGRPRLHVRRIDSTNARARQLAEAGAPHGALVSTEEQTAGRGRQGRTWTGPRGRALMCSLVLRDPPALLPLAAAAAVAEVVGPRAQIKWPNDILLDGGKLCGILIESRPGEGWAVLGMGLNVAVRPQDLPEELRARSATMGLEPAAIDEVLERLLAALTRWLQMPAEAVLAAVRERDALLHQPVRWAGGHGRGGGIDDRGRLVVLGDDGSRMALDAGEVHLLR